MGPMEGNQWRVVQKPRRPRKQKENKGEVLNGKQRGSRFGVLAEKSGVGPSEETPRDDLAGEGDRRVPKKTPMGSTEGKKDDGEQGPKDKKSLSIVAPQIDQTHQGKVSASFRVVPGSMGNVRLQEGENGGTGVEAANISSQTTKCDNGHDVRNMEVVWVESTTRQSDRKSEKRTHEKMMENKQHGQILFLTQGSYVADDVEGMHRNNMDDIGEDGLEFDETLDSPKVQLFRKKKGKRDEGDETLDSRDPDPPFRPMNLGPRGNNSFEDVEFDCKSPQGSFVPESLD